MKDLKKELIFWAKYLSNKGLLTGSEGNLSFKIDIGFFITPTGKIKETLTPKDLSLITFNGEFLFGEPSSEWGLHQKIYLKCKDAKVIVHCHPPYVLAMEKLGFDFKNFYHPEATLIIPKFAVLPYFPPGSKSLWEFGSNLCINYKIILLSKHGVVARGETFEEAINLVLLLEKLAYLEYLVYKGGKA
ncbi:MAG: class II aldolase/adducin family protein [Caldimicrobium sp.]